MKKDRVTAYSILLIFFAVVVLYHLAGYTGHFGYDDLHYARLANGLLHGQFDPKDHFAYRFPVVLFTAFFYLILGVSDLASSLPAMLVTVLVLVLVFRILRPHGPRTLWIGLSLTLLSNWFLFYSDKLMPDIYVALAVLWSLAVIHRYKYGPGQKRAFRDAFLFALALLFGFMSKGTIVLMIPLLVFLLVTDLIRRRDLKFWGFSLASGIFLLAVYLFAIRVLTGSLMSRFEVIADNSYLNLCSYDQQSLRILLKRIFTGFFSLAVYQSLTTGFIFVLAALFQRGSLKRFRLDDSFSFFLVSAVILFLSSSFMTISVHSYSPMCLDPRHYLFLVPVAAIPASRIISDFLESRQSGLQVIGVLSFVAGLSLFLPGRTFWILYLPLLVLFALYYFAVKPAKHQPVFLLLFTLVLLLVPLDMVRYAQQVKYRRQKEVVVEQVLQNNNDCIVITDEVQSRLLAYYSRFSGIQSGRFLSFDEFEADTGIEGRKLLLLNGYTRYLSGMEENDLPYFAKNVSPLNPVILRTTKPDLAIYQLEDYLIPDRSGIPLLSSFNDFEAAVPHWSFKEQDLFTRIRFRGTASNRVSGYSSTFEYPLDSLNITSSHNLYIQTELYCYAGDETGANIVISLENDAGTYFWKALGINRYLKAYSNWWPVSFEVGISQKDLLSQARLKVYLWNTDKPDVYIDNFSIKVYAIPDQL
jgi:4-amino-4-deoxy-L-arabinose transferase-like glycosyltransferase